MIGYYSVLRKLNNLEGDGEILANAKTYDKYWDRKRETIERDDSLRKKINIYYRDLGKYIPALEKNLRDDPHIITKGILNNRKRHGR